MDHDKDGPLRDADAAVRGGRRAAAAHALRTVGPLTARAYAGSVGVSPATALRDLRDLAQRGLVEATGTTNDRRYRLRVTGGG